MAQVHLAVHESTLRIFAGEGGAATSFNQKLHDLLLDVDGTVAGNFYRVFAGKRMRCEQLLHITSLMELELDFSDHEELEFADRSELSTLAAHIETVISRLANSFSVGNAIKNGIPLAIIGETNAVKSTLLNVLLNEDKAIVSDIKEVICKSCSRKFFNSWLKPPRIWFNAKRC